LYEFTNASFQQKETSQAIFPYKYGHGRTELFQTSGGRKTTRLAPGSQGDNKSTDQAGIRC